MDMMFRNSVIAIVATIAFVTAGLLVYIALGPGQSGYTVSARTETVTIRVADPQGLATTLPVVDVPDASDPAGVRRLQRATLEVPKDADITARRKRDGVVYLQIDTTAADSGRAILTDADGAEITLPERVTLPVSLVRPAPTPDMPARSDTLLIAFRGNVQIGDDVARLVEATLLEGSISIVERGALFGERYVVRDARLDPGDRVLWRGSDGGTAEASGFLQAGYGEALQITAYGTAQRLEIVRLGVQDFSFEPLPWDRIARNPIANLTAILLGLLAALFGFIEAVSKLIVGSRRSRADAP